MRAKLSEKLAQSAKPGAKPYQCHDMEIRGFILRVEASGTKCWYLDYRTHSGQRRRLLLGHYPGLTADQARLAAKQAAGEIARGGDPVMRRLELRAEAERAKTATLGSFISEHYKGWAELHLKSGKFLLQRLEADFGAWRGKQLQHLDRKLVEDWRKQRLLDGLKPVTVNRDLQRLQGVLSRAVDLGILETHPFGRLKPLKTDKRGRVRYLSPPEESRLREALVAREEAFRASRRRLNQWRAARHLPPLPEHTETFVDYLRPLVLLAINTGLRRGELLSLRWEDVFLDQRTLVVRGKNAKSGQTRWIPLNDECCSVLSAWRYQRRTESTDQRYVPVFGLRGRMMARVDTAWRRVRKMAALVDFRFHDLRHHFASRLAQTGTDLNVIRELLGHSDLAMVLRYSHLADSNLRDAVSRISGGSIKGESDTGNPVAKAA